MQPRLFDFLDAVGGLRPPETLEERMRAMTVICRLKRTLKPCMVGGSEKLGNVSEIGRRDFNLSKAQVRVCSSRAQQAIDAHRHSLTSDEAARLHRRAAAPLQGYNVAPLQREEPANVTMQPFHVVTTERRAA